jgi:hypothetical protein
MRKGHAMFESPHQTLHLTGAAVRLLVLMLGWIVGSLFAITTVARLLSGRTAAD